MSNSDKPNWPADADGDVLKSLHRQAFDFSVPHSIEFEIDFDRSPNSDDVRRRIIGVSSDVVEYERSGSSIPYFVVTVRALITYELVVEMQRRLSELTEPIGGHCEAWGLLH